MELKKEKNVFYYGKTKENNEALIEFEINENKLNLSHTEGKNEEIAKKVVKEAIAFAKENNYEIEASCPFANRVLNEK